jgi:integrase
MGRPSTVKFRQDRDAWVTTIGGKYVTLARGKRNRRQAMDEFHRLKASEDKPGLPASASVSVGELCDRLLDWVAENRSAVTYEWYKRHLSSFVRHAGPNSSASALRPFHVTEWIKSQAWEQSTRHGAITAVKRAFRWGRKQGYLEFDPMEPLDKPGIKRRETILRPDQEHEVLNAIHGPLRDYLEFMHETGCRPSEVARLEASHLSEDAAILSGKTTRATGRLREIYWTDRAKEIVDRLAGENPAGPNFRNSRGAPWTRNALAWAMSRVRKRLGLGGECTAESFRHGWITDAKLKQPNSVVAQLAGHSSTATVDKHYGHLNERRAELSRAAASVRGVCTDSVLPETSVGSRPGSQAARDQSSPLCGADRTPRPRS